MTLSSHSAFIHLFMCGISEQLSMPIGEEWRVSQRWQVERRYQWKSLHSYIQHDITNGFHLNHMVTKEGSWICVIPK